MQDQTRVGSPFDWAREGFAAAKRGGTRHEAWNDVWTKSARGTDKTAYSAPYVVTSLKELEAGRQETWKKSVNAAA
jgi:hypothetical protein